MPESYVLAQELLAAHLEADPGIVLPVVLLHDITRRRKIEGAALAAEPVR